MTIAKWQGMGLSPASPLIEGDDGISYAFAFAKILVFFVKLLLLILLLGLLIVAFIVWIWVTGFRSGWEFFEWVYPPENSSQKTNNDAAIASRAAYGFLILLSSPFALFVNWSEELLKENLIRNFSFPSLIDSVIPTIRKQLGLDEDEFPCLTKKSESVE